ncbi:hypothetical protein Aglo03_05240 [Actinokineospora globicatena]|uniref:Uncharacterized protein n=1 Tax=Actinokineospora globicatena TaxID=103729 RepID=A0A9W6QFX2_9PSEU|nr:hypothetical protein Aglo03_05240 [Actinokineospora globicatena]
MEQDGRGVDLEEPLDPVQDRAQELVELEVAQCHVGDGFEHAHPVNGLRPFQHGRQLTTPGTPSQRTNTVDARM